MDLHKLTDLFGTHIFSFQSYHIVLLICLMIDRINAKKQGNNLLNGHLMIDFLYPILNLLFVGWFYMYAIEFIRSISTTILPSAINGLLSNRPLVAQAIGAFMVVDFTRYCTHYLSHKIPLLWGFHSIHHSATEINSFTTYRLHAFEILIGTIISVLPVAIIGGNFESIMIVKLFDTSWGYVVHSNCVMKIGILGKILVTPQYHKIHHSSSRVHFDTNFSSHLTLWDILFNTRYTGNQPPIKYGIEDFPVEPDKLSFVTAFKFWYLQFIFPMQSLIKKNQRHALNQLSNNSSHPPTKIH